MIGLGSKKNLRKESINHRSLGDIDVSPSEVDRELRQLAAERGEQLVLQRFTRRKVYISDIVISTNPPHLKEGELNIIKNIIKFDANAYPALAKISKLREVEMPLGDAIIAAQLDGNRNEMIHALLKWLESDEIREYMYSDEEIIEPGHYVRPSEVEKDLRNWVLSTGDWDRSKAFTVHASATPVMHQEAFVILRTHELNFEDIVTRIDVEFKGDQK